MGTVVSIRETEWNDLGARLANAATTLTRMSAQTSSDAERSARLDDKAAAVAESYSAWRTIGFSHTESSFAALTAVVEDQHRASTGGSRQGYALALDYLRGY